MPSPAMGSSVSVANDIGEPLEVPQRVAHLQVGRSPDGLGRGLGFRVFA